MDFDYRGLQSSSRAQLRAWQDERLRLLLAELATNQFYQEKFGFAGMKMAEARGAADLNGLPFTTKSELAAEQLEHPPYGRLLTYPLSRYRYLHQTSGTTGRSLRWLDTAEDWETFMRCWAEVYRGAGVTAEDLVFCAFSFGPYVSHWTGIDGARYVGALALSGGGMSSVQRLRAILDNRCTAMRCTSPKPRRGWDSTCVPPTFASRFTRASRARACRTSGDGSKRPGAPDVSTMPARPKSAPGRSIVRPKTAPSTSTSLNSSSRSLIRGPAKRLMKARAASWSSPRSVAPECPCCVIARATWWS